MSARILDHAALRDLCRQAGADDTGFVEVERETLAFQRESFLEAVPWARSFIVVVRRLNKHTIRVPWRSVSGAEFTEGANDIKAILRRIEQKLDAGGVRAVGVSGFFPMEFGRLPNFPWVVSLKDLAQAAGLGVMGKNRLVLHPNHGANIYLGAIAIDAEIDQYSRPLDDTPCLTCNLCAVTCPTGAIAKDGHFDFASCLTHNYREKIGGFVEWVHTLADSRNRADYRRRVSDAETLSWWQSLGYEAITHCDYCMAVCPAGDEATSFLSDRKTHFRDVVRPLRDKSEPVYVVPGSDAESHVLAAFPHKRGRHIGNGMAPGSVQGFIGLLPHVFQRGRAKGLTARYHFRFRGREIAEATVDIREQKIKVETGLIGKANLTVTADSDSWLGFLAKDRSIAWELLRGKIRLKGSPRLLLAFGKCFPS
ncbi:MAG: 4Fe-4S ferredoxin [Rhodospirillales bacterium]|nr:MAG: 4Fe-4S ferredoxin [Rhodospirillales bacterium]